MNALQAKGPLSVIACTCVTRSVFQRGSETGEVEEVHVKDGFLECHLFFSWSVAVHSERPKHFKSHHRCRGCASLTLTDGSLFAFQPAPDDHVSAVPSGLRSVRLHPRCLQVVQL